MYKWTPQARVPFNALEINDKTLFRPSVASVYKIHHDLGLRFWAYQSSRLLNHTISEIYTELN